jgi:hypothetical protein
MRFVAIRVKRRMAEVTTMATKIEFVNQSDSNRLGAPMPPAASIGSRESVMNMEPALAIVQG